MDNILLQKIKDLIDKNDKIGIAVGKNPTIDTMAAALSLQLGLQDYGKQSLVASATQPLVEHSSLVGIDKVKGSFEAGGGPSGDLVVSFPYREGEIEKVSYTIESGYLNIVVKAGQQGLTFSEQEVKFRRGGAGGSAPSLLFIVGTSRLSDLGQLFDTEALKNTAIINIDNKPDNQGFGDVPAVSPNTPSVSEMIASLLYYLGIDPSVDTAQNLMHGITDGTNNMQDPRVSYTTFELVANLMKKGAANRPPVAPAQPDMGIQQPPFPQPRPQQQYPAQPQPYPRPQAGMGNRMPGQQQYQRPPMPGGQPGQRQGGYQRPQMPRRDVSQMYDPYGQNTPMPGFGNQQMPQMPGQNAGQRYGGNDYSQQDPMQSRDAGLQPRDPGLPPQMPRRDMQQRDQSSNRYRGQQRHNQPRRDQGQDRKPPSDWLTPKVYKGSSDVE